MSLTLWLFVSHAAFAAQPHGPRDVEAAARDFRIEVYGLFRNDRPAFDAHRKAGETLLNAWIAHGRNADDATTVAQWFDDARAAALAGKPLPPTPRWDAAPAMPMPPAPPIIPTSPFAPGYDPAVSPPRFSTTLRAAPQSRVRQSRSLGVEPRHRRVDRSDRRVGRVGGSDRDRLHGDSFANFRLAVHRLYQRTAARSRAGLRSDRRDRCRAAPNVVTLRKPAVDHAERAHVNAAELRRGCAVSIGRSVHCRSTCWARKRCRPSKPKR
ncbi:MAG: hypothetical protein QM811_25330 [Pirellulales bacterium]